jgi:hypothetical protein
MSRTHKIVAGFGCLLGVGLGVVGCHQECPQCPKGSLSGRGGVSVTEHRPQGVYLRGSKLDNGYTFFYGDAKNGVISATDEKGTPTGATLIGFREDGTTRATTYLYSSKDIVPDPCVKDASGDTKPFVNVPTYALVDASDASGTNVCGKPLGLGGSREDFYNPEKVDTARCGDDSTHYTMSYRAIAVPGYWDKNDKYQANFGGKSVFTVSCINAIVAKCAHWGYVPWAPARTPPGDVPVEMVKYHQACVNAALANYTGAGPRTCGGTVIDIFDNIGVQNADSTLPSDPFEAAWDESGDVCVTQARYTSCVSHDHLPSDGNCSSYCDPTPKAAWKTGVRLCTRARPNQYSVTPDTCPIDPQKDCL